MTIQTPTTHKENIAMDLIKFLCCTLVALSHMPYVFSNAEIQAFYGEWFFRFSVPFFFLCSGYFFGKSKNKGTAVVRTGWLVVLGMALYLPAILQGAQSPGDVISKLRWNLVFGYEHLWFLSAQLEGLLIWYIAEKIPVLSKLLDRIGGIVSVLLLLIGALLDEHYPLCGVPLVKSAAGFLLTFGGPKNVVFIGFPLLYLGGMIAKREQTLRKIPTLCLIAAWVVFRAAGWLECRYLFQNLGYGITVDISFFNWLPSVALLLLTLRWNIPLPDRIGKGLRKIAEYVYILHPMVMLWIARFLELQALHLWIFTVSLCAGIYLLVEKQFVPGK